MEDIEFWPILDERWKNTPVDLTSNLLLLQRITDALRLSTLSPQCDIYVYVGNKDLYDRDGFYVGDTYYMIGSQQGWREMSKDQTGNRPKNKPPSGETIRVRLMYSKPPSILLNNHQRILDTVTALKRQIGGCVWGGEDYSYIACVSTSEGPSTIKGILLSVAGPYIIPYYSPDQRREGER